MDKLSAQYSNSVPRQRNRKLQREHSKSSSKLKWNNVKTEASRKSLMSPSLEIKDYDPSFALRKIAMLYENDRRDEIVNIIANISIETLLDIYREFPIDLFLDSIPRTLGILNCLMTRLYAHNAHKFPKSELSLASLVMQIVKLYNRHQSVDMPKLSNWDSIEKHCRSILRIIGYVDGPVIIKMLHHRKKCLHRADEGLGKYGLVEVEITPSSEERIIKKLLSLPEALQVELERMVVNSKYALTKLSNHAKHGETEAKAPTPKTRPRSAHGNPATNEYNHQRVIGLTSTDIQERLFDNKVLLNVVEPVMQYAQLPGLLELLQERIARDKDVLLTFSQIRKEIPSVPADAKLSHEIIRYSKAFNTVINILKEFVKNSDVLTNDHVDNDLTPYILCDGQHPMPSRTHVGRSSFGSMELPSRKSTPGSLSTLQASLDKSASEIERLKKDLKRAHQTIDKVRRREKDLIARLSKQAETFISISPNYENIESGAPRSVELIKEYRNLYSEGRVQALDDINEIFHDGDIVDNERVNDVKTKLLFSVIVLSFRSVDDTIDKVRMTIRDALCMQLATRKTRETEATVFAFLKNTTDTYDLSQNIAEVFDRVCDALFECHELRSSRSLKVYVAECVRLAWVLSVQTPAFIIEYDAKYYDASKHERFHTADDSSGEILSFLWPSLLERESGKCLSKGIVVTGYLY